MPVPEGTTDVVSLMFSASSSEVLEILCLTGTSTGICMIFFLSAHSKFLVKHM